MGRNRFNCLNRLIRSCRKAHWSNWRNRLIPCKPVLAKCWALLLRSSHELSSGHMCCDSCNTTSLPPRVPLHGACGTTSREREQNEREQNPRALSGEEEEAKEKEKENQEQPGSGGGGGGGGTGAETRQYFFLWLGLIQILKIPLLPVSQYLRLRPRTCHLQTLSSVLTTISAQTKSTHQTPQELFVSHPSNGADRPSARSRVHKRNGFAHTRESMCVY